MKKLAVLLLMLSMCGCAAAAPVALGTGSAVADMVLGEAIKAGAGAVAAEIAPQAVAMVMGGMERLSYFGGNPGWEQLLPVRHSIIQGRSGMKYVGNWQ